MSPPTSTPSPRVLHVTQPVDGGVARVVSDLVRAQSAAGFDVTVACPGGGPREASHGFGADVRDWPATRAPGPSLPGEVRRLARLVEEIRPDVVHAHSSKAGLAARLAVRGRIPTVFQPHAWSFDAVGGMTAGAAMAWERWAARWAAVVLCVSEAERARGMRAGVRAQWQVIPNGVDPRRFHVAGGNAARARLAPLAGLDPAASLVVCVGRLCRQKGQDVLLEAWPSVLRRTPGARLVLVGDGPAERRLRDRAPEGVLFAGAVTDCVPWYQAADLVVLPSRWEGMALAPLEAMACGRPVVVTDVTGARESLPPGHRAHCLVPADRPGPLAEALAEVLRDPLLRESLGQEGRRHVLAAHHVGHSAEAVADIYRRLIGGGHGTARPVARERREFSHS